MTEAALGPLRDRLQRFNSTGDPAEIIGDAVMREISALAGSRDLQSDMTALEIVAWLYWYRSQAIPDGASSAERESATKLFELMYVEDPQSVPGALQPILRERRLAKQQAYAKSPFAEPGINVQETMRRSAEQFQRYHLTSDPATLDDSISGFRRVLAAAPPGHVLRPMCEVTLGLALQSLWERASNAEVLNEGVARLRSGLGALPATHETRPMVLTTLAAMLHNQYLQREDPALLDESARLIDEAAATVPPDSPLYAQIHAARDMMSAAHPASQNDPGKLDQAIAAARARLEAAPHGHPDHPQAVLQLGMAMAGRFSVTRVADSLDETTDLLREAVATAPPDWPQLPALRTMLASVLSEVAIRDGNLAESAEAIDLLRAELPGLDPKNPLASVLHGSLAVAVWHRYVATEEPGLLTEAIDEGRIALGLVTGDSPARAPLLHNLGNALNDLYRRTGDLAALDEAITLSRRAELTISGAGRAIAMNSLATSLILRHQRTDDADTANEAVTWGRRAVEAAGKGHPDRLTYVVTLAQALEARSSCAGHQADLQETIDLLRQTAHVVAIREHTDQDLQYVANALASALLKRSTSDPDLPAVEEALSWLRRATAGRAQSSARDRCLGLLGKALQRRYELTRDRGALAEALAAFTAAANPDLSPTLAVFRNVERGRTAAALLDWPLALEALGAAIEGLPLMAARHLDRADQEHALTLL